MPAPWREVGTMQIPAPFDYVRATSVDNALELLARVDAAAEKEGTTSG